MTALRLKTLDRLPFNWRVAAVYGSYAGIVLGLVWWVRR